MISSDVLRGYNDLIILSILMDGDSYGYEVSKAILDRGGGVYHIKETTLYSAFNRLEANGYLVSYFGDETFGRRRTYFKITASGIQYYYDKCREWKLTKELIEAFCLSRGEKNNMKNNKERGETNEQG